MKDYEIYSSDKIVGKVRIFKSNINKNLKNSLIISKNNFKYDFINHNTEMQTYELIFDINDVDDIYDIVTKYKCNEVEIFDEVDNIKKYNNLKSIKKNTELKIIIPEIYLNNFNKNKDNNIDKESLLKSKVYFIKKIIELEHNNFIMNELNSIINEYKYFKESSEYEFTTDIERENKLNTTINNINKIIKEVEQSTNYKYGKDFIIPIAIENVTSSKE